jgi:hypothetical protein
MYILSLSTYMQYPISALITVVCHLGLLQTSVAMAQLITAPDPSTSGAVGFLQSWKDTAVENYVAPTMCICTLHTIIL